MVVAPAGYGKTSLIAEWAKQSKKKVIWYTMSESDSFVGINNYLIAAIREAIPNFEPDLEAKTVTSIFQAIANLHEDVVLVLDNVVDAFTYQLNTSQSYMDAIPENIHIFALRRTTPTVSLKRFSSIGRLSIITAGDLVFSKDEIKALLQVSGTDASEKNINQVSVQTHGWPLAVAIIASGEASNLEQEVDESLVTNLVSSKFVKLAKETRELLIAMSSFDAFDLDLVSSIMQKPANEINLNKVETTNVKELQNSKVKENLKQKNESIKIKKKNLNELQTIEIKTNKANINDIQKDERESSEIDQDNNEDLDQFETIGKNDHLNSIEIKKEVIDNQNDKKI
jgi:LuxR family maltose regulon positive regulatory protein